MRAIHRSPTLASAALAALALAAALGGPARAGGDGEPAAPRLAWIEGSTRKQEQVLGDEDRETGKPTRNRTETRWKVIGADLGSSFEHAGQAVFLFGDTMRIHGDAMARSASTEPEKGLLLDFFSREEGRALAVDPPGVSMKAFEVPVAGIDVGGRAYVVCKTNHADDEDAPTDVTVLTRFDDATRTFSAPLREISRLPAGRFIKMALHHAPAGAPWLADLPFREPAILMWGSGRYRKSDVYLAVLPAAEIESGKGTRYFAGLAAGKPTWSEREADARPVVADGTIGDVSVTLAPDPGLWLMTADTRRRRPHGVDLRTSATPWGPWSEPETIFEAKRDGALGKFIFAPGQSERLAGPVIGKGKDPLKVHGGGYAPYVIERFTRRDGDRLAIHYLLSTWNPYVVVLMRSDLRIVR